MRLGWIPGEYNIAYLLTKTKMTGNMRNRMVELIIYNKVAIIGDRDKTKWKESNQSISHLVSNTSKYLLYYQRNYLKRVALGWYSADGIKSVYTIHS